MFQGIRSFNPDEPTEIKFFLLTIFLGPNGAGKTTIIESLKYALTGSLPPNCNNGKRFVYDVQYAKRSMIHGQIRLKFIDTQNKSTVITRNLQSFLKMQKTKPTIKFRQRNAIIITDVNKEALEFTGYSRAVLDHIIFYQQEETNWPLSDDKVLKERFDDIFGSIGYVKVLDKIKKLENKKWIILNC
ncbi:DNA repair protein rad50 [Blomia tropicalis]|nr:DNA repair protein rad50 [Blomia tropicalis]